MQEKNLLSECSAIKILNKLMQEDHSQGIAEKGLAEDIKNIIKDAVQENAAVTEKPCTCVSHVMCTASISEDDHVHVILTRSSGMEIGLKQELCKFDIRLEKEFSGCLINGECDICGNEKSKIIKGQWQDADEGRKQNGWYTLKSESSYMVCETGGMICFTEMTQELRDLVVESIGCEMEYIYIDKDGKEIVKLWYVSNYDFTDSDSLSLKEITEICQTQNEELVERGYDKEIYNMSKKLGINPKIILATLAQEQGWCRNGGYEKAFGIGPGGRPEKQDEMGGLGKAIDTYLKHYNDGLEMENDGLLPTLLVNQDIAPYYETKAQLGEKTESWQAQNPAYVKYMEKGVSFQPINAAMYAKLKYTPWLDFPPADSHPLDTWNEIYNSF